MYMYVIPCTKNDFSIISKCLGPLYTTLGWTPTRISSASNFTVTWAPTSSGWLDPDQFLFSLGWKGWWLLVWEKWRTNHAIIVNLCYCWKPWILPNVICLCVVARVFNADDHAPTAKAPCQPAAKRRKVNKLRENRRVWVRPGRTEQGWMNLWTVIMYTCFNTLHNFCEL